MSNTPEQQNKTSKYIWNICYFLFVLLILLSFHFVPGSLKVFPKDHMTLNNTLILSGDINELLERYNNAASIFEQMQIREEPLFKKLSEKGLILVTDSTIAP
jgi:hypothetical protein